MSEVEYNILSHEFSQIIKLCLLTLAAFDPDQDVKTLLIAILNKAEQARDCMERRHQKALEEEEGAA